MKIYIVWWPKSIRLKYDIINNTKRSHVCMCSIIDILEKEFQDIIYNSDEIKKGISEILLDKKESES